jgi:hypothetical protein
VDTENVGKENYKGNWFEVKKIENEERDKNEILEEGETKVK